MKLKKQVPLVTVKSLDGLKEFYCEHFGFRVAVESGGYLGLAAEGGSELAFMTQDHDAVDPFGGKGLTICLEVHDVDAEARRLVAAGLPVEVPLRDNPWGDRSIILRDPVGIHVYVYRVQPS